jgi:hypothetical protein
MTLREAQQNFLLYGIADPASHMAKLRRTGVDRYQKDPNWKPLPPL